MTNREWINQMTDEELADWLCSQNMNCDTCTKRKLCSWFRQDGFLKWLKQEAEEES